MDMDSFLIDFFLHIQLERENMHWFVYAKKNILNGKYSAHDLKRSLFIELYSNSMREPY